MSWRTVLVQSQAKLTYKNNYLIVRNDEVKMIHLSEISTIIIDSTKVTITAYLIAELVARKIKIVFCDSRHNPAGEVMPYYGCVNSSLKIQNQIRWSEFTDVVWTEICKEKIKNQAKILMKHDSISAEKLFTYVDEVELKDSTNREGHAAKVYFRALFGKEFSRDNEDDEINFSLNYGYSILLSSFNRGIVSSGYLTQVGINHHNPYNSFNLSSDLMEPFRPLVDRIVLENIESDFDQEMKLKLINVLNEKVKIKNSSQYVSNAISIYVKSVFEAIEQKDKSLIEFFEI